MDQTLKPTATGAQPTLMCEDDVAPTSGLAPPLDWTYEPRREEFSEGGMQCRVTTAAHGTSRRHQPHLNRMVEIEPQAANGRGLDPSAAYEHIRVTERDLRRCGSNIELLRQCDIGSKAQQERGNEDLNLSFKSAWRKK